MYNVVIKEHVCIMIILPKLNKTDLKLITFHFIYTLRQISAL